MTARSRSVRVSTGPTQAAAAGAGTRVAPAVRPSTTSRCQPSKFEENHCSTRSAGVSRYTWRRATCRFSSASWSTEMAFGGPVDPDV